MKEEAVANAIFSSKVPIISAVGHETDFTIADFVADLRAPTPTGAAEMAAPHMEELMERVLTRQARLIRATKERIDKEKHRLGKMEKSYAFRYPKLLLDQKMEQLDKQNELLQRNIKKLFVSNEDKHDVLARRLKRNHPQELLHQAERDRISLEKNLTRNMNLIHQNKSQMFHSIIGKMDALSPLKIMERGYNLAYSPEGKLISSVKQVNENEQIELRLSDGTVEARVTSIKE